MEQNTNTALAKMTEKHLVDKATEFISASKDLILPPNYDYVGATKSFFLTLPNVKGIERATAKSIEQGLFDMITQGWDIRKKQCYPIVYGNSLAVQESYFGIQKRAKTYNKNLKAINANVIYQGDKFATKIEADGRKVLISHESPFSNQNNPIIGAYAVAVFADGKTICEVMTYAEIQKSWAMSKTGGAVHKQFPVEMCKKTVRSRLAKSIVNVTDDSAILDEELLDKAYSDELIDIEDIDASEIDTKNEVLADIDIVPEDTETDEYEDDFGTYSEEEMDNYVAQATEFDEKQAFDESSDEITVSYGAWKNDYLPTKEWEQVPNGYNNANKTITIRRKR